MNKKRRHTIHLEKRAFSRIPALIDFHCFNIHCFGTITNISANGMFMKSQNMSFPFKSQFNIHIPVKNKGLDVHVKVVRITKSSRYYDGIGVKLLNPTEKYLEFISNLNFDNTSKKSIHN